MGLRIEKSGLEKQFQNIPFDCKGNRERTFGQISPFGVLLQTYSPNGVILKEFPPWCCFVRGLHGFCMENASFNGEFVSTGHVDGNPLLLLTISG